MTNLATLAVVSTVGASGGPPPAGCVRERSSAFVSVPGGFVALGLMTTRSNSPVPPVVVCSTSGFAGTTTVAVPLAVLTQAGHPGGHSVLVDFDCRAFAVLGQPSYILPGRATAHRSPIGADCGGS